MVIEDDIADQVKLSVEALEKSFKFAKQGKLDEAFFSSKTAFVSSGNYFRLNFKSNRDLIIFYLEKAFFDKSLLEKLYFPEDQRFPI